jgi:hypothetical protein
VPVVLTIVSPTGEIAVGVFHVMIPADETPEFNKTNAPTKTLLNFLIIYFLGYSTFNI